MFAGRYLWWMLISVAVFLSFAACFDYATWLTAAVSGCARTAGSCGPIIELMSGLIKPMGLWTAGALMLFCTFARIRYLSMSYFWSAAAFVWFIAAAPFALFLGRVWVAQLPLAVALESLPLSFLFLLAFLAYLLIPFEEKDGEALGSNRSLRLLAVAAALHSVLTIFAQEPGLAPMVARLSGISSAAVAALQSSVAYILDFGTGNETPAYIAFALFCASLAASLLPDRSANVPRSL